MSGIDHKKLFFRSLRLYFAPLTGAIRGIRAEYRRIARHDRIEHGPATHAVARVRRVD